MTIVAAYTVLNSYHLPTLLVQLTVYNNQQTVNSRHISAKLCNILMQNASAQACSSCPMNTSYWQGTVLIAALPAVCKISNSLARESIAYRWDTSPEEKNCS